MARVTGRQQGCWEVEVTEAMATTAKQNITYRDWDGRLLEEKSLGSGR